MLSADLVIAQQRKEQLLLPDLAGKAGETVRHWAEQIIDAAKGCIGLPRQEFSALVQLMGETQQARKLTRGLAKILEDACQFEQADAETAAELRQKTFLCATQSRRQLDRGSLWSRDECIQRVCDENGWDATSFDERLYADLPGAQRLLSVPNWSSEQLFERYDQARVQSVLLRAVQVRVRYARTSVLGLRELFRQIKFRQLLHQSKMEGDSGLHLTIDGPMTLFESATKYGLQLALLLPALGAAGPFELEADVRWGKSRRALQFAHKSQATSRAACPGNIDHQPSPTTDEIEQLLIDLQRYPGPFVARPSTALIELPGVGLCVPDITFSDQLHPERCVHFEMLGYWSREAVWRRVELVEAGLGAPVVFGVNQRLRVSQEVLSRSVPAALYVFRGRANPIALLECVGEVARRQWPGA
jgi:predicted nuclease of restriction endonuclease-like RecB superfamily